MVKVSRALGASAGQFGDTEGIRRTHIYMSYYVLDSTTTSLDVYCLCSPLSNGHMVWGRFVLFLHIITMIRSQYVCSETYGTQ